MTSETLSKIILDSLLWNIEILIPKLQNQVIHFQLILLSSLIQQIRGQVKQFHYTELELKTKKGTDILLLVHTFELRFLSSVSNGNPAGAIALF